MYTQKKRSLHSVSKINENIAQVFQSQMFFQLIFFFSQTFFFFVKKKKIEIVPLSQIVTQHSTGM